MQQVWPYCLWAQVKRRHAAGWIVHSGKAEWNEVQQHCIECNEAQPEAEEAPTDVVV